MRLGVTCTVYTRLGVAWLYVVCGTSCGECSILMLLCHADFKWRRILRTLSQDPACSAPKLIEVKCELLCALGCLAMSQRKRAAKTAPRAQKINSISARALLKNFGPSGVASKDLAAAMLQASMALHHQKRVLAQKKRFSPKGVKPQGLEP